MIALARRGQEAGELSTAQPDWWHADCLFALLLAGLSREGDGRLEHHATRRLVLESFWSGAAAAPAA